LGDRQKIKNIKGEIIIEKLLKTLTNQQIKILKIATNAIYFNDNSDYLSALWDIVNEISGSKIEYCDSKLFDLLNYD